MSKPELVDRRQLTHFAKPTGWFQIGWSHEYPPGTVQPLKYFGEDLVAYRTETGKLIVSGAFCPHFGAHLGYGGKVAGECIQCPFHGWQWGPDGRNAAIPYSVKLNRSKQLVHRQVRELDGIIFMWHSADGAGPLWEPPNVPELSDGDGFYSPYPHGCIYHERQPLYPQFILENNVDYAHLDYVHEWDDVPKAEPATESEWVFRSAFTGSVTTKAGTINLEMENLLYGVGFFVTRLYGLRDTVNITGVTPVDETTSDVRVTVGVKRLDEDPIGEVPKVVDSIRGAQAIRTYNQDYPIWAHQMYNVTPPYPREEAADFIRLRRWSEKFYQGASPFDYKEHEAKVVTSGG